MITKTRKAIAASGTTAENEPIIKSDGDGEVMQWIPSDGEVADGITIDEPGAGNPLRLGIGTISPDVLLKLNYGGDDPAGTATRVGAVSIEGAYITLDVGVNTAGSGTAWMQTRHKDVSANPTAYYPLMINPLGGNVGIGVSPEQLLHIKSNDPQIYMEDGDAGTNEKVYSIYPAGSQFVIRTLTDAYGTGQIAMVIDRDGTTVDSVTFPNGNVGIGITPTGQPLEVKGDVMFRNSSSQNNYWFRDLGGVAFLYMYASGAQKVQIATDANPTYFGIGSGNVGVGLAAPAHKFECTGGIVETNGVLKSNLLTNSGFDVWSNSTLEDATGSNLVTGWTNGAGGDAYETFTTSSENITSAINSSGNALAYFDISGLTTGKLYEISLTLTLNSGTGPALATASLAQSGGQQTGPQFVAGANSWVWEQGDDDNYIWLKSGADTSAAGDWSAASVTLKEVTPGCVAANALGPDGWSKNAATNTKVFREHTGSDTKDGSFYSLKLNNTSSSLKRLMWPHTDLADLPEWYLRHQGRTHTFGAWVKYTGGADEARVGIDDSDGTPSYSAYHSGGGAFEWLEVTRASDASITSFGVRLTSDGSSADETMFFSQPMLVFGSAIGSGNYSRPSGEIVVCESKLAIISDGVAANDLPATGVATLAADDKILNLEALSGGKIPKGAKAIFMEASVINSSVTASQGIYWGATSTYGNGLTLYPLLDNFRQASAGYLPCDSNGDVYQTVNEAGATLSGYYMYANAIQLR